MNCPSMIHSPYNGLAKTADAEKWCNVQPATAQNVIPMSAAAMK